MQRGHDGARAGAAGRPVEHAGVRRRVVPPQLAVGHDDGIARGEASSRKPDGGVAEGEDVWAGVVDLGVVDRVLLSSCDLDHLSEPANLAPVLRLEHQPHRSGVDDDVKHAAVRNVDGHLAHAERHVDFDAHVARAAEGGRVAQLDLRRLAVLALRLDLHQPSRQVEVEGRGGRASLDRDHPSLEEGSGDADHVVARHGRVDLPLLRHHHAERRLWPCRRQDKVGVLTRVAARLVQQESAVVVEVLCKALPHLHHGSAVDVRHATDDDARRFATAVAVDDLELAHTAAEWAWALRDHCCGGSGGGGFDCRGGCSIFTIAAAHLEEHRLRGCTGGDACVERSARRSPHGLCLPLHRCSVGMHGVGKARA
mmetsp:Transcript_37206/g.119301  ORF Transcript_37206/g.119301 Transcript_37206/m.119301 type:complete len:368 (-) Transcript_37206:123-1226(-)